MFQEKYKIFEKIAPMYLDFSNKFVLMFAEFQFDAGRVNTSGASELPHHTVQQPTASVYYTGKEQDTVVIFMCSFQCYVIYIFDS